MLPLFPNVTNNIFMSELSRIKETPSSRLSCADTKATSSSDIFMISHCFIPYRIRFLASSGVFHRESRRLGSKEISLENLISSQHLTQLDHFMIGSFNLEKPDAGFPVWQLLHFRAEEPVYSLHFTEQLIHLLHG